jgi:Uma2 family endonuclease
MTVVVQSYGAFRAEDLLAPGMPEKFVEIIEGELVTTTPANPHHNRICYRIECLFDNFRRGKAGLDFGGSNDGFLLKKNPDTLLSPDASLHRKRPESEGTWLEFAPEIAVEVLSPGNTPSEIAYKTRTYLAAGSEQVWLVNPEKGSFEFIFRDGRRVRAEGDEVIHCEGIAEGLEIDLKVILARE